MSPGTGADVDSMFLAHTMPSDYEDLCRMDVLGIKDPQIKDQGWCTQSSWNNFSAALRGSTKADFHGKVTTSHYHQIKQEVLDDFQALYSD